MNMLLDKKLELSVRLVVECLQKVNNSGKLSKWSSGDNVVQATLSDDDTDDRINIVGTAVQSKSKCIISLFRDSDDTSLGHTILSYEDDLGLNQELQLPVEYEEYIKNNDGLDAILEHLAVKLQIKTQTSRQEKRGRDEGYRIPKSKLRTQDVTSGSSSLRRPADMPEFEDEYQIHQGESGLQSRIPGLERGYGDSDLHPTGEKYPNLTDPTSTMRPLPTLPGQGGMIFDPLREQARRSEEQEGKLRGPGWIPGAKFDDPYGHPGSGGGTFPGSNGMGFGGGGFI